MARTDSIDADDVLMPLQAASSTYRIAFGPWAGRKVLSLQYATRRAAPVTPQLCANAHGPSAGSGQGRRASGDRAHFHAPGVVRAAAATGSGAAG